MTSEKLAGVEGEGSERSGSGINYCYRPQERYETLKKVSHMKGKDEFICGHLEGEMPLEYANGDVQ